MIKDLEEVGALGPVVLPSLEEWDTGQEQASETWKHKLPVRERSVCTQLTVS